MINTNGFTLTPEETMEAEKFHYLLERNMNGYWKWWKDQYSNDSHLMSKELGKKILEHTHAISLNAACTTGYYGMTVLHQLVTNNYYDAVELLLQKGVSPNVRGCEGKGDYTDCYKGITPFHIACYSGNYKMVKLLLEYGADTTLQDNHGRNCYHLLAARSCSIRSHRPSHNMDIAKQLLKIAKLLKCDVNQKDDEGNVPLIYLVQNEEMMDSLFLINHFIDCGADVMVTDREGNTALMFATENSHITASAVLMQYPELINLQNHVGDTALHRAFYSTKRDNPATAYMLMEKGADCHIRNHENKSVADYVEAMEDNYYTEQVKKCIFQKELSFDDYFEILSCFTYGWIEERYDDYNVFVHEIARAILRKVDKDDDTENVYIKKILEKLLSTHNGYAVIPLLCEEGYDLCMPLYEGRNITNIRDICLKKWDYDFEEIIPQMQKMGVDINKALSGGCTPAFLLVDEVGERVGDHVYERVADVLDFFSAESMEQLTNQGQAAIHVTAGKHKNSLMLEKMIEKGIDVNVTTDAPAVAGNTPLHFACIHNNVEAVILLKENGADDSIMNQNDETPAYCIFEDERYYNKECAYKILEMLDDVDTPRAENGETPILHLLRKNYSGVKELVQLFLDKGVNINRADNKGNTPLLMHADRNCDRDIIKLLLRAGADINARNSDGNNALMFALKHGDCELARLLIKKGADYNVINEENETPASIAVEDGYESVLELMTDIKVFPISEDYEEEDEEEDDDSANRALEDIKTIVTTNEEEEDIDAGVNQQYMAILNGYILMYGEDKGRRLGDIIVRMTEMSQNGLTQDNMEEYRQLTTAFQAVMQSTDSIQTQEVEQSNERLQLYKEEEMARTEWFQDKTGMFTDFNFKLVVINSLLDKKTSFSEELAEMIERYVDEYEGEEFACIPKMVEYFENLRLTETDLAQVDYLIFDGGEEIYSIIMPDWDGESAEFEVRSVKGFEQLINLKTVEYISMCDEDLMKTFEEAEIEVV